jgi:hypothetical protein
VEKIHNWPHLQQKRDRSFAVHWSCNEGPLLAALLQHASSNGYNPYDEHAARFRRMLSAIFFYAYLLSYQGLVLHDVCPLTCCAMLLCNVAIKRVTRTSDANAVLQAHVPAAGI